MTTVTETFNFVENPLTTNWTNVLATANFQSTASGAKRASLTATNGATMYKAASQTFANDQRSTITFGSIVADDRMGVIVRAATTGGGQFYRAYYHDGDGRVYIHLFSGGAVSTLVEQINSMTFANGDTLGLDVTGTTLRAYKNGVAIGSGGTDATLSSGQPGMFYLDNNNNTGLISVWVGVDAAASGPNITGGTANPVHLSTGNTITGTGFGASQGAGTLVIGGQAQTVTAWSDTSITYTANRGVNLNDVAVNAVVTDNAAAVSNNYALTGFDPPAGYFFVTLASVNSTAAYRITAIADLAIGNQLEWDNADVTIANDATFSCDPSVTSFNVRVGVTTDGWGSLALQTVNSALAGSSAGGRSLSMGLRIGKPGRMYA